MNGITASSSVGLIKNIVVDERSYVNHFRDLSQHCLPRQLTHEHFFLTMRNGVPDIPDIRIKNE
jgi:hypothetical protein